MIDLYTWSTPNGYKASIMLEEVGLAYTAHPIDILGGAQRTPEYIAINPNSKIPAIVDPEGPDGKPITVFESGAILIYLAEKTGSDLLPADARGRYEVLQWLMFQMGGVGPMFGQCHHFMRFAPEDIPYAKKRYGDETKRLYGVLDARLQNNAYMAGDAYSIADVATFPWVSRCDWQDVSLDHYPNVKRWFDAIAQRPAVQKGMKVPK
ncbi:glutathione S-transferase family protein [Varunaivibrio sulfuroxidans]|uniref:GST-like protein n=1 Tax=Varunaivibrio sulfuroxidans TaxID=1773489 RepID=A0A4V2UNJ2_9PROT|nr:glutathione binding-like protein [Varunaivibrio sulfuroxidans]TCS62231.1 GST-like protein [Varunaivibrio sulfuroxidans]WES30656.1 glutathione binding-like protein [Varunaivibrio sulfuroxidans]